MQVRRHGRSLGSQVRHPLQTQRIMETGGCSGILPGHAYSVTDSGGSWGRTDTTDSCRPQQYRTCYKAGIEHPHKSVSDSLFAANFGLYAYACVQVPACACTSMARIYRVSRPCVHMRVRAPIHSCEHTSDISDIVGHSLMGDSPPPHVRVCPHIHTFLLLIHTYTHIRPHIITYQPLVAHIPPSGHESRMLDTPGHIGQGRTGHLMTGWGIPDPGVLTQTRPLVCETP